MIQYPAPNAPGLLWAAPYCLHDTSSGAAMLVKCILEQLAKRNVRCHALSALTFDSPSGTAFFPNLEEELKNKNINWFNLTDKNVNYQYLATKSRSLKAMTRAEEKKFYLTFLYNLETFKPDVLLFYGGGMLEMGILTECKRRGIATVMQIPNGYYLKSPFHNVDLVIAESVAFARQYYASNQTNVMPTGTFIHTEQVLVQKPISHEYITFINPSQEKGVSLFLYLALWAKKKHPDWRFMVVESRGTWEKAINYFGQNPNDFTNVNVVQHVADIRLIYAKTKLLLAPSLWNEGFGRVATEAVMNGIPVLSSNSGGLPESVRGGGICLDAPPKCRADFTRFPQEEEMQAWTKALETLLDPKAYPAWLLKAQTAGKCYDIENSTDTLMGYLKPLFDRRASFHPQYFLR